MTDGWHIPLNRIIKIWHEVETTWKDALLIAFATGGEQAWRDLATYQAILTTVEKWMVEQWEIVRPGSGRLHRVVARSRQYRASRRLLYEIAVASEGGMKWWIVLGVERNASAAEVRTAFDALLKRYHHKKPNAALIAKRASKIMTRAYEDANSYTRRRNTMRRAAPNRLLSRQGISAWE
jgi:hypothetical protein